MIGYEFLSSNLQCNIPGEAIPEILEQCELIDDIDGCGYCQYLEECRAKYDYIVGYSGMLPRQILTGKLWEQKKKLMEREEDIEDINSLTSVMDNGLGFC